MRYPSRELKLTQLKNSLEEASQKSCFMSKIHIRDITKVQKYGPCAIYVRVQTRQLHSYCLWEIRHSQG